MNVNALKERLAELETTTNKIKYVPTRYFTDYDSGQVERLLYRFMDDKSLCGQWSNKRKGWIIKCPGIEYHDHRPRNDDCTLATHKKGNGFVFIRGRCRHSSCGGSLMAFCRELNKEWGEYLNSHYTK